MNKRYKIFIALAYYSIFVILSLIHFAQPKFDKYENVVFAKDSTENRIYLAIKK